MYFLGSSSPAVVVHVNTEGCLTMGFRLGWFSDCSAILGRQPEVALPLHHTVQHLDLSCLRKVTKWHKTVCLVFFYNGSYRILNNFIHCSIKSIALDGVIKNHVITIDFGPIYINYVTIFRQEKPPKLVVIQIFNNKKFSTIHKNHINN